VARILLLLIFAIWLLPPVRGVRPSMAQPWGTLIFIGGYGLLVAMAALLAEVVARRSQGHGRLLQRFHRLLYLARWLIPLWLVWGVFGATGWKHSVIAAAERLWPAVAGDPPLYVLPFLLGVLPALLAWVGLWWAAYPAERLWRERGLLEQFERDLPVRRPPGRGRLVMNNLRQQLLFVLAPILLVLAIHDMLALLTGPLHLPRWQDDLLMLPAAAAVYLLAPELLRRILGARPMEDSELRRRLEEICRRVGLRYRDILVWHTDYSVGNAAVMGLVPRWRYILMSDLLLQSMHPKHVEAVFAHELGHIVHHHMRWFLVFFIILALIAAGPASTIEHVLGIDQWAVHKPNAWLPQLSNQNLLEVAAAVVTLVVTFLLFGFVSRRVERQADVFAARMMQSDWSVAEAGREAAPGGSYVGEQGAGLFAMALHRVAAINNLPLRARDFFHGSIERRMRYIQSMGADPRRTACFDRGMGRLYGAFVAAVVVLGVWAVVENGVR
jgi:STE24 endopeptidase